MPTSSMQALPLHATKWSDDKPLPLPPSPTLTNPDFILPNAQPAISSPPRSARRPPSPSYLRDTRGPEPLMDARQRATAGMGSGVGVGGAGAGVAKKEKLGLVSRKMMLLRSKSGSNGHLPGHGTSRAGTVSYGPDFIPSSPILQDVGNLAPEQPQSDSLHLPGHERRTASGSSSSDLSGMTTFLEKYGRQADVTSDDEALYDSSDALATSRIDSRPKAEAAVDEQWPRLEEEYESLSMNRAEQILANAKKRLNVMEGNLRGARDLVQPLTAANLKRATSLSGRDYGNGRFLRYDYDHEQTQSSPRRLHTQQSSPNMGNDFQGHNRGYSEHLPERPYTSLDHHSQYVTMPQNLRNPPRVSEQMQGRTLRGSKSYDMLGAGNIAGSRAAHNHRSPDPNHLAALPEDEERRSQRHSRQDSNSSVNNGLGIYRPASRTSDLRDQMSSLKGRISTLKDRAREDSLRRRSQSNLRNQSPLNNAIAVTPELYHPGPLAQDSPHVSLSWEPSDGLHQGMPNRTSRNAFDEAAAAERQQFQQARMIEVRRNNSPGSRAQSSGPDGHLPVTHRRSASGTLGTSSAPNDYKYHKPSQSQSSQGTIDLPRAYLSEQHAVEVPSPGLASSDDYPSSPLSSADGSPRLAAEQASSEASVSVYEDANEHNSVVAHEDRDDAFDYEHFFLSSAMGSYSTGRRESNYSEDSTSSAATARGFVPEGDGEEDIDEDEDAIGYSQYPPPIPQTPNQLRQIERNHHERKLSDESVATMETFATADEGHAEDEPVSPLDERDAMRNSYIFQSRAVSPIEPALRSRAGSSSTQASKSTYRGFTNHQSRVRMNVVPKRQVLRRNSSSERADSGVGIPTRTEHYRPHTSTGAYKHSIKLSNASALSTPPTSPHGFFNKMDPTTVVVQALLDPNGKPLGLRNKAVLFGIVESLRKVVGRLQEEDDVTFASRMLRNTLDEAKRTLDGL